MRKKMKPFYRFIWLNTRGFFRLFYRHRVYGLEHRWNHGAIIASNHTSFYDPPILAISSDEEVHFLARSSLFRYPLFANLIEALNSHPIQLDAKNISVFRKTRHLLEQGKKIVMFPEGSRSYENHLGSFKPGLGSLIYMARTAVIPAYIAGSHEVWGRRRKFPKLRGKTACVFGSPIRYEEFSGLEKKEAQKQILLRLRNAIDELRHWYESGAEGSPP